MKGVLIVTGGAGICLPVFCVEASKRSKTAERFIIVSRITTERAIFTFMHDLVVCLLHFFEFCLCHILMWIVDICIRMISAA